MLPRTDLWKILASYPAARWFWSHWQARRPCPLLLRQRSSSQRLRGVRNAQHGPGCVWASCNFAASTPVRSFPRQKRQLHRRDLQGGLLRHRSNEDCGFECFHRQVESLPRAVPNCVYRWVNKQLGAAVEVKPHLMLLYCSGGQTPLN